MNNLKDDGTLRHQEERRELMRIAAQSALDRSNGGKALSPDARRWALHWASIEPLKRPSSSVDVEMP